MEILHWQAPEFEYFKKSTDWYWSLWIISVAIMIVSFLYNNTLFSILIFITAFTLSLQATRKPKIINIELDNTKIKIDDDVFLIKDLEAYWIKENDSFPRILIKTKHKFFPLLTIPLGNIDHEEIDEIEKMLSQNLEERELHEPAYHLLAKYI